MRLLLSLAVLVALAAVPAPAQKGHCSTCKGQGTVACTGRYHNQRKICGVPWPHRCTALFEAPCCHGLGRVICPNPRCSEKPVSEFELDEQVSQRVAWAARMRAIDKKAGIKFEHVQVDGWLLHSSIKRWKKASNTLNQVRAAHAFMDILRDTSARFKEVTGTLPAQRQTVFLVADSHQQLATTLHFMGTGYGQAYKLYSPAGIVSTWPNPLQLKGSEQFESHVCHLAAHELIQAAVQFRFKLPAWIDAGLAHWIELDVMKRKSTFCFRETTSGRKNRWQTGKWKKMIHAEVRKRSAATLAQLSTRDADNINHREHAHVWSFVDFLIHAHPKQFPRIFATIKRTGNTKKALDDALGWSTQKFQEEWSKYVRKTYSPR